VVGKGPFSREGGESGGLSLRAGGADLPGLSLRGFLSCDRGKLPGKTVHPLSGISHGLLLKVGGGGGGGGLRCRRSAGASGGLVLGKRG